MAISKSFNLTSYGNKASRFNLSVSGLFRDIGKFFSLLQAEYLPLPQSFKGLFIFRVKLQRVLEGVPAQVLGFVVAEAEAEGALVFHAGTALHDGRLVTNGGRIFGVTGLGETLAEARNRVYAAADHIEFDGVRYRSDIASLPRA